MFILFGLQFVARAEYLWWNLDDPEVSYEDGGTQTGYTDEIWLWKDGERLFINEVRVRVQGEGVDSYLTVGLASGGAEMEGIGTGLPAYTGDAWAAIVPSSYASEGYNFIIEMGNSATGNWIVMASDTVSYSDLAPYISLEFESQPERYLSEAFVGAPGVIPEPTSGMLILIGAGLLALRRRRRA